MKKIIALSLALLAVILLLARCAKSNQYRLCKPVDEITKIEIVNVGNTRILTDGFHDSIQIKCEIEPTKWDAFLREFYQVTSKSYWNDPACIVEGDVIRITYQDDSFEVIGPLSGFYFSSDREWKFLYYYFDEAAFTALIEKWSKTVDDSVS